MTWYVDFEGGTDSNSSAGNGDSFATRRKYLSNLTAASLVAGDEIRFMASPDVQSVGSCKWFKGGTARPTGTIASSTNATPIVMTVTGHGYSNDDIVLVFGHTTNTNANGYWQIANVTANTFELVGSVGNGVGGATGTAKKTADAILLPSQVTELVVHPTTTWTASANVTCSVNTSITYGRHVGPGSSTLSAEGVLFGSSFTTGLAAYYTLPAALDLTGYERLSFCINTNAAVTGLQIKLCTDTAGATPATNGTFSLPDLPANKNHKLTLSGGGDIGSGINSIAVYATADPGTAQLYLGWFMACKAASSADGLTMNTLIGKEQNLSWAASTAYALNSIRRPTPANRNGWMYKATAISGTGTSGGSEPTWPTALNETVVDNSGANQITWTCHDVEDGWHPIHQIYKKVCVLGGTVDSYPTEAWRVYAGHFQDTETIATYKREPITLESSSSNYTQTRTGATLNDSGTQTSFLTLSGGWNRTDMSSIATNGETVWDGLNGYGRWPQLINREWVDLSRFVFARMGGVGEVSGTGSAEEKGAVKLRSLCFCDSYSSQQTTTQLIYNQYYLSTPVQATGIVLIGVPEYFAYHADMASYVIKRFRASNINVAAGMFGRGAIVEDVRADFLAPASFVFSLDRGATLIRPVINCPAGAGSTFTFSDHNTVIDANIIAGPATDALPVLARTIEMSLWSQNHDLTGESYFWTTGAVGYTQSTTTRTGSKAWRLNITSLTAKTEYTPVKFPLAAFAVNASAAVTVTVYLRRDHTDMQAKLICRGGQIAGVPSDVSDSIGAAADTWEQQSITFTPTSAGAVEIEVWAWCLSTGAANRNLYIDDVTISQV